MRLPGSMRLAAHRALIAIPVLFGITLLTFFVLDLLPGSAARQLLGSSATPEQVAELEIELGLNRPAGERYVRWLSGAATGDLGKSIASGQPVTTLVASRLPVTLELVVLVLALSLGLAIPAALLAAWRPNRLADRLTLLLSMGGLSMPSYVLAPVLVLVFSVNLAWLPSIGFKPLEAGVRANLQSLVLPTVAIALPLMCFYARFLRGDLVEQINGEDYIVTARAKGIGPWRVLVRHALRNSAFGLLTLVALNLGALIGGTVIVEQIFALPGIGQLLLQSINTRDAPIVQAIVLLLALTTVFANLCVDLLYAVLDPRIRHGCE